MSEDLTQRMPNEDMRLILTRLDSIDTRLNSVDTRLDSVDTRLGTLEDKVDRRLQETKPIWERALAEIAEVRTEMREGFEKSRVEMDDGMRLVARQVDVLNRNVLEVRADLRYLDRRITKLEGEPTP
jgi:hypothetical protein